MRLSRIVVITALLVSAFLLITTKTDWGQRRILNQVSSATPIWSGPLATHAIGLSSDETNNIDIYKSSHLATVNITSTVYRRTIFFEVYPSKDQGSGFLISADGKILTNSHVVANERQLEVTLSDQARYKATLLSRDEANDLALLQITPRSKLPTLHLGDSDALQVGQKVLAIGNPFGLEGTLTTGIVSSLGRSIRGENERTLEGLIQTDAAINPGNSGGPLVNLRGELIGLNVAVYREEDGERGPGVGFSIPVKQISATLSRFFTPEWTDSLWFGAQFKAGPGPLVVSSVQPGSPAARAGLSAGDQVLTIDGEPPQGLIAASRLLSAAPAHKVTLQISRGKEHQSIPVQMVSFENLVRQRLGLTLRELTAPEAKKLGITVGQTLLVEEIEKGSPAERAQLQRGYLVASMDGKNVGQVRLLAELLAEKKRGEILRLGLIAPRRLGGYMEFRKGTVEIEVR